MSVHIGTLLVVYCSPNNYHSFRILPDCIASMFQAHIAYGLRETASSGGRVIGHQLQGGGNWRRNITSNGMAKGALEWRTLGDSWTTNCDQGCVIQWRFWIWVWITSVSRSAKCREAIHVAFDKFRYCMPLVFSTMGGDLMVKHHSKP